MTPLHRHQLAHVTALGWKTICDRDWDATARSCLRHWAERGLPLVVTRQVGGLQPTDSGIDLGLPAPGRWNRQRIALRVPLREVMTWDEFPDANRVTAMLPEAAREPWERLCTALQTLGVKARVYGSYGWQQISGLDHVREGSDIDVWMGVSGVDHADAVAQALQAYASPALRLDGELVFDGRTAAAWREWQAWRRGGAQDLLVKTITGASLVTQVGQRLEMA